MGTIELNSEYENILMSKKINILEYMGINLGWKNVYDIKCTGVRVKKVDEIMRKRVAQWLTHDDNYYTSIYFYIATPGSLFEAYLVVITGKKNALMAEQLDSVKLALQSNIDQLVKSIEETNERLIKTEEAQQGLLEEVQTLNNNTSVKLTSLEKEITTQRTSASAMSEQLLTNITTLSDKLDSQLSATKNETQTKMKDMNDNMSQQLTTMVTKLEEVTKSYDAMMKTFAEKVADIQHNLDMQVNMINNKIEELSSVILPSGGDGYVIVK
jgi:SMC interacting uncharacterized protein involved in chromosome segregation